MGEAVGLVRRSHHFLGGFLQNTGALILTLSYLGRIYGDKGRNVGKIHYSQKCKIFEKNALVLVYSYLLPKYCQIKITHKVFVAPNIKHLLLKCLDSFLC